jgi:hypothetical protein
MYVPIRVVHDEGVLPHALGKFLVCTETFSVLAALRVIDGSIVVRHTQQVLNQSEAF